MRLAIVFVFAASLCAQIVPNPVAAPVFTGSGLNDMSAGGQFLGTANVTYAITLAATGTPDKFSWSASDGGSGTSINITGGTCAALPAGTGWQTLTHGVQVCWLAATGHHVADAWSVVVTANGTVAPETFIQSGVGAVLRGTQVKLNDVIDSLDFGTKGDGVTDDSQAITRAIAASYGRTLHFRSGNYKFNNSAGPVLLTGWTGRIAADQGAYISCSDDTQPCFEVNSSTGVTISDLGFTYPSYTWVFTPPNRIGAAQMLTVVNSSDVVLTNLDIHDGPSAAILIQQDDRVQIAGARMKHMGANGVLLTNSTNVLISHPFCDGIQDYCVELSGYDPFAGVASGTCGSIVTTGLISINSFSGYLVNGCTDTSLSNFVISNTYSPAIVIGQDTGTTVTKWPYRALIGNGTINQAGYTAAVNPQAQGIWLFLGNSPPSPIDVSISNVLISNSKADGIGVGTNLAGDPSAFELNLSNVTIDGTGTYGVGIRIAAAGHTHLNGVTIKHSFAYCLYTTSSASVANVVDGSGLFLFDCEDPSRSDIRAWYLDNAGAFKVVGVTLQDDRNPAAGYQLADSALGPVLASEITSILPHGSLSLSPGGAGSKYTLSSAIAASAGAITALTGGISATGPGAVPATLNLSAGNPGIGFAGTYNQVISNLGVLSVNGVVGAITGIGHSGVATGSGADTITTTTTCTSSAVPAGGGTPTITCTSTSFASGHTHIQN